MIQLRTWQKIEELQKELDEAKQSASEDEKEQELPQSQMEMQVEEISNKDFAAQQKYIAKLCKQRGFIHIELDAEDNGLLTNMSQILYGKTRQADL